jgi:calcineurin-like phosphoesterase family protein
MEEAMIANWNACVKPGDIGIMVGDSFFCGSLRAKEIMSRLNGYKILISGNHDGTSTQMRNSGFDFVCERMDLKIAGQIVHLSHFPYRESAWHTFKKKYIYRVKPTRYLDLRLKDDGAWLLHGHTHSSEKLKNKMIHVGVDAWNFKPIHLSVIEYIIQTGKIPPAKPNPSGGSWWKL